MPVTNSYYHRITNGIRVTVRPSYLDDKSRPSEAQYVFSYSVRIENVGEVGVQLLSRRWHIHDSIGEDQIVEGEGVVGEQPVIAPGHVHEYESYCVLKSPEGHMEGSYFLEREDSTPLTATIPRFLLRAE